MVDSVRNARPSWTQSDQVRPRYIKDVHLVRWYQKHEINSYQKHLINWRILQLVELVFFNTFCDKGKRYHLLSLLYIQCATSIHPPRVDREKASARIKDFFDGLATIGFDGCPPLVRRWNGYIPSLKSRVRYKTISHYDLVHKFQWMIWHNSVRRRSMSFQCISFNFLWRSIALNPGDPALPGHHLHLPQTVPCSPQWGPHPRSRGVKLKHIFKISSNAVKVCKSNFFSQTSLWRWGENLSQCKYEISNVNLNIVTDQLFIIIILCLVFHSL